MQVFLRMLCREGLACVAGASNTSRSVSMSQQTCLTPLDHQVVFPALLSSAILFHGVTPRLCQ